MWSPSKISFKTPKALEERHCHTEMRKQHGAKSRGTLNQETCQNDQCNPTMLKQNEHGDSMSMYPTLQCPRKSSSKPSTVSFTKPGKEWTFNVYKDRELGFNGISDKVIPTKADEDVRTTTDILNFGEGICIGDLRQAIDMQKPSNLYHSNASSSSKYTSYSTK